MRISFWRILVWLALVASSAGAFGFDGEVALADLPVFAQRTYALIQKGGHFPFEKDGSVFGNYEGQLPLQKRGYYREYTVKADQQHGRGAIRIVCASPVKNNSPQDCYYTNNHYATFKKIVSQREKSIP